MVAGENLPPTPREKIVLERMDKVKEAISAKGRVLVAFSGGVDSSTLAALTYSALGSNAMAVTADSLTLLPGELEKAKKTAQEIGIRHTVIQFDELAEPGFADNPPDRCYYCKKGLYRQLKKIGEKEGFCVIADATNASELEGHRPGFKAAREEGIFMPFVELGVTKEEIRRMARLMGLSVAEKPQLACLSSRFPYGQRITPDALKRVGEAEVFLRDLGLSQVRVRSHGNMARIETPPREMDIVWKHRDRVVSHLKKLGFNFITLDLEGYRTGSMNKT